MRRSIISRRALALKPDYAKPENNLGMAFYQKGDVPVAISHFKKALEIRPDLPEAHNDLANILFRQGHVDEAIAHYKMALKTNPDYPAALTGLGNGYFTKGDMDNALSEYQHAIDIQPDLAEIQNNIGNVYLRKGRVYDAISHYKMAVEIDPGYVNALNSLAWLLSTADASVRDGTKAVALAEKANQLSGGKNAGVLGTLAAAYAETGRFPEALDAAGQALRLATAANDTSMMNVLTQQISLYQKGMPFHQSSRQKSIFAISNFVICV